jgi:hypothetical protein
LEKTVRPLFAWIGVFIAAGGVFLFLKTVVVLSVRNLDRPVSAFHFKIPASEKVTLFYINSMYDEPVEEIFEVRDGDIILKAVITSSPAVMEYYGFDNEGPTQPLHKILGPAFLIQASMGQDQGLRVGKRAFSLRAIAGGGDSILVSVGRITLARFLWCKIFQEAKIHPSTKH